MDDGSGSRPRAIDRGARLVQRGELGAVWFVGDGAIDMECAAAAELTPIFFGQKTALSPQAPEPAWFCPDCDSVLDLVVGRLSPI